MTSERNRQTGRGTYEWIGTLVRVALALVLVCILVGRITRVDGASMRETLQEGDLLAVLNGPLCGPWEAGDIVIVRKEGFRGGAPIVKRVIATEGQTVDIDFDQGVVYVDGTALDEPYVREPTWLEEGISFPLTVPEGNLFVLGDNRNQSEDSRSPDLGPVDSRCVLGRAVFLVFPGETAGLERREWNRIGRLN